MYTLLVDEDVLLVRQPAEDTAYSKKSLSHSLTLTRGGLLLPGVFSLEASEVKVESRASDLNFFSGTCSVVWCVGALYFLSAPTHRDGRISGVISHTGDI